MKDLSNNISPAVSLAVAVRTAAANGTGVDLQGYESATALVDVGAEGDTLSSSVFFEVSLEHSDDDSTFTAVTASTDVTEGSVDSSGIFLTLDANGETPQTSQIGYIGGKRYARVKIDATGTHSNGTPISIQGILGNPIDSEDA